jgi:prophage DNA circulation protein
MADFDQLPEAEYRGIRFPLESSDMEGGNDFVEHTAYRRRGADMEPAGIKAYRGSLTIPLINSGPLVARYGRLWPDLRGDLIAEFESHPIGTLVHPTWGTLEIAVQSWSASDDPGLRNGQRLKVTFEEHNGSLASLVGLDGAVTTDPTTTVQTQTAQADALGAPFAGYAPTSATIDEQMTALESATVLTSSEITAAFRTMNAAVDRNLALPSLAGTAAHEAVVALLAVRVSLQSYYARFAPNVSAVRYYRLPAEMSVAEIAQTVYGDISRVALLYAANSFTDPLLVPAGTLVTVLPT